jgi:hypothetical protein
MFEVSPRRASRALPHIFYIGGPNANGDLVEYYQLPGEFNWNTNRLSRGFQFQ